MTPAFQVLLCLCLLGLSCAAPKARNVRWCVRSDIEEKKCNDLVNSCIVNDISLICVKKSSTEDCVRAISNGEADAISLDSEDLYKASLNPFNLKPIITESYHSQTDVNLATPGPCQKERQRLLEEGRPLLGAFVPECNEKGNYSPKQCHGSTGYCWCVNEEGKEIDGTKTPPGQPPPTCEDEKSTPCLRHRQSVLGGKVPKIGAFVPKCDEKGDYVPKQCHGSTGYCWCVNTEGEEIHGTRVRPGKVLLTCGDTAKETPCLKEHQKVLGAEHPLVGAFVPDCDEKGNYNPKQCHGSTGYCWCVNEIGEEISGSKTPPGQPAPTCGASAETPCIKERQKVLGVEHPLVGAFVPDCDEKGNYSPKQCHGSTGYCWCVTKDGEEIDGTKTPPGQPAPTCEEDEKSTPCLRHRQSVLGGKVPKIGAFVPKCDEKGDYVPKQCHGSTGYCWCVNTEGEEIHGTRVRPGKAHLTCEDTAKETPCLKERQKALSRGQPLPGSFVPDCDEKGNYSPKQCHGSTGYCWCVNENGEEISGSRTPPGQPAPTCGASAETPCIKERQKVLGAEHPLVGAFAPDCDEKGNYSPKQCHGSTGYCWCVNEIGEEISGSKTPPGQPDPTCGASAETPCIRERQKVLGAKQPLLGAFVPDCDEKGNYSPKQCHGSTGYCWCVNEIGVEISGSKTPPGQPDPTCGASAETPCIKERQKVLGAEHPLVGAFVPDCDEKGNYSPKQCHGSTGYCWCVNENGEEISGSRTSPRQPAPTCGVSEKETLCLKERQKALSGGQPLPGSFVPDCDEKGNYNPKQCHGSTGYCWCVTKDGEEIDGTKTPPGQPAPTCEEDEKSTPCLRHRQSVLGRKVPKIGAFVPKCDEKGDYVPKQCHGSTGYCWCVNTEGEEIHGTRVRPGKAHLTCGDTAKETPCLKERQKALSGGQPLPGSFVLDCDEKGNYSPKQCHGSTGYCWCVNENGEEISGSRTPPGQPAPTCGASAETPCIKERQKVLGAEHPLRGAFVPDCDEKGNYSPKQCHGSTGYCWCVNENGEEISGSRTPPGKPAPKCGASAETPCIKERQKVLGAKQPLLGAFVPDCDEKGNYSPKQCHGSTGYCWCVSKDGKEIQGTRTAPGQSPPTCKVTDPVTCHYAVAVVKKSSTFQFVQLKGKRSCHSAVGNAAGWISPFNMLLKEKLLLWETPEEKSFEKAASEFFSASCAPGATEENLCKQCAGQEEKCKRSPGEPYYGDEGAFRCLRDDKGDVAFVEDTVLSGQYSDEFELLCPDNTRRPLSQYKDCNFGKVPTHAVVTSSTGDKIKDITEYLLEAQKKECKLFSSTHGMNLLFEDTTTSFITLPSAMDTYLFLGPELFNAMKTLHGAPLPSNKEIRWCTQSKNEKIICDNWAAVSGGAIKCTEASSAQKCIEMILKVEAEATVLSVEHMYTALKCGLVLSVEEYHNKDDLIPCQIRGAEYTDFGTRYAVAVVKKSDKDITWNNLKGKKSCHTGVGDTAGWNIPVGLISKQTKNCDIGSYFNESCAPGSDINSNLCKLCIGDPQNTKAGTKCSLNDKEAYYGNEGAFRCLVEKGDVAFMTNTAVLDNTDGKNPALWAKDLKSTDFELLCPDGSRASVKDYKKCKLTGIPPRAVVTRQESLRDVVRIIINQESLYGRNGFQKGIFQMFSSDNGQNSLFSDGTQCLIEFDRMIDRDIMDDYFGKPFYKAVHKDNPCLPPSALASACAFHHC